MKKKSNDYLKRSVNYFNDMNSAIAFIDTLNIVTFDEICFREMIKELKSQLNSSGELKRNNLMNFENLN